jgi:chromosomal replication initiation ATPase DnaA
MNNFSILKSVRFINSITLLKSDLNLDIVLKYISSYFNKDVDDVKKRTRLAEIIIVRQTYHYFCKKHKLGSLYTIGAKTGHDHATVINSYKTICNLIDTDKKFASKINEIENTYFN